MPWILFYAFDSMKNEFSDCSPHLYRWEVPVMRYHLGSPRQVADAGRPGALRVSLPPPDGHYVCYSLIYIRVFNPH